MMNHVALLLQEAPEPVTLGRMAREYAGFLSYFAVYGALGFHFQVLRSLRLSNRYSSANVIARADRRAAVTGLLGALVMVLLTVAGLAGRAAEKHTPLLEALSTGGRQTFQIACSVVLLSCFALATQRNSVTWRVAAVTAIALALRNIVTGRWFSMVNPLHEVAASL